MWEKLKIVQVRPVDNWENLKIVKVILVGNWEKLKIVQVILVGIWENLKIVTGTLTCLIVGGGGGLINWNGWHFLKLIGQKQRIALQGVIKFSKIRSLPPPLQLGRWE